MANQDIFEILKQLLSLPSETECLEFKEAKNNFDFNALGKYFSALSNEANLQNKQCAWLVFGINNKHQIVGTQFRPNRKDLDSLKQEVAEKVNNRLTFINIHEIQTSDGRVIMFEIPPALRGVPTSFGGWHFGRDGESTGPLNLNEIDRIRNQVAQLDWSAGICERARIDHLDPLAIARAREEYGKKYPNIRKDLEGWDDITFLNKAKITIEDRITNSAILLLGKEESLHFVQPVVAQITWILKDKDNIELDYEHFSLPLLLSTEKALQKIRNLKYRYLPDNTLFPTEITQYEPWVIREALHNCIAHQDYSLQQKINLVEFPEHLIFENGGNFLPQSIEAVINLDAPQRFYRNNFLCNAMVSLNMIDIIGSGIKKMFQYQRNRYFPLPEYEFSENQAVRVTIYGKIIDKNYTQVLINQADLSLNYVISLDKVQKGKLVSDEEAKELRKKKLIEGRKPNYFVSAHVAAATDEKAVYIRNKAFDDDHYKKLIIAFIQKYNAATRKDIDDLLFSKLSDVLDENQKRIKIGNLLTSLKKAGSIYNQASSKKPCWVLC